VPSDSAIVDWFDLHRCLVAVKQEGGYMVLETNVKDGAVGHGATFRDAVIAAMEIAAKREAGKHGS